MIHEDIEFRARRQVDADRLGQELDAGRIGARSEISAPTHRNAIDIGTRQIATNAGPPRLAPNGAGADPPHRHDGETQNCGNELRAWLCHISYCPLPAEPVQHSDSLWASDLQSLLQFACWVASLT